MRKNIQWLIFTIFLLLVSLQAYTLEHIAITEILIKKVPRVFSFWRTSLISLLKQMAISIVGSCLLKLAHILGRSMNKATKR